MPWMHITSPSIEQRSCHPAQLPTESRIAATRNAEKNTFRNSGFVR
jgi:hypothetical protein